MTHAPRLGSAPAAAADTEQPEAERRMRRALGLPLSGGGGQAPAGRRPEGPAVEHRAARGHAAGVNRVAAAETALAEERKAREQLARQVKDLETALRESETKRGHAELARDEAAAARTEALARLEMARQAQADLQARLRGLEAPESPPDAEEPLVRRRGRPRRVLAEPALHEEGEPVQWWLPGWRK